MPYYLCVIFTISRAVKFLNLFQSLFTNKPLQVSIYSSNQVANFIKIRINDNKYDVIIFQLLRSAQFLPSSYRGICVLNMIDPLVLTYQRSLIMQSWPMKVVLRFEIMKLKLYENKILKSFNKSFLISQKDINDYKKLYSYEAFEKLTYGVDTDYFLGDRQNNLSPKDIVITGNMGYKPNIDGVLNFCENVFPLILAKAPDICLWLVGARPDRKIKRLHDGSAINVTGHVSDMRPYLNNAFVSICPVRLDVGVQTKVLEAMSMGVPVITTSAGNAGIAARNGIDLIVADSPRDVAAAVLALFDGHGWDDLSKSGRKFVEENFKWEISFQELECSLKSLTQT